MTLQSLGTDFSRVSARLLALWQERPEPPARDAAAPGGGAEEDEIPLLQAISQSREAIALLTAELETARRLARDRREAAAAIALLARDMSREAMDELHSEMDGGLEFLTLMTVVFTALLFLAAGSCFLVFLAFSKGIINPLSEIALFAKKAADGETASTLSFSRNDELGDLAHALRALAGARREAVSRMQHREREGEQQKRKAEQLLEKAAEALRAVKKREQEIVALVNAVRERDRAASSLPAGPAHRAARTAARTEQATQTTRTPGPVVPEAGPVHVARPTVPEAGPVPAAMPDARNPGKAARESETALRDLAEMSAGMHKLIRQLADK
jgi:methyl-accepting chemotaxis protein